MFWLCNIILGLWSKDKKLMDGSRLQFDNEVGLVYLYLWYYVFYILHPI